LTLARALQSLSSPGSTIPQRLWTSSLRSSSARRPPGSGASASRRTPWPP
jgi:hypothetical protein